MRPISQRIWIPGLCALALGVLLTIPAVAWTHDSTRSCGVTTNGMSVVVRASRNEGCGQARRIAKKVYGIGEPISSCLSGPPGHWQHCRIEGFYCTIRTPAANLQHGFAGRTRCTKGNRLILGRTYG